MIASICSYFFTVCHFQNQLNLEPSAPAFGGSRRFWFWINHNEFIRWLSYFTINPLVMSHAKSFNLSPFISQSQRFVRFTYFGVFSGSGVCFMQLRLCETEISHSHPLTLYVSIWAFMCASDKHVEFCCRILPLQPNKYFTTQRNQTELCNQNNRKHRFAASHVSIWTALVTSPVSQTVWAWLWHPSILLLKNYPLYVHVQVHLWHLVYQFSDSQPWGLDSRVPSINLRLRIRKEKKHFSLNCRVSQAIDYWLMDDSILVSTDVNSRDNSQIWNQAFLFSCFISWAPSTFLTPLLSSRISFWDSQILRLHC